jgi:signal transduction histidine kinase/ActR/RegA family two-component response regulator
LVIDEHSLFLVAGLVIALCGGLLLLVRDREASRDALTWWAVAMLLGGAGVLLLADYGSWPRLLCSELSRALLLLAGGSSWTAARIFTGGRPRLALAAAGAVLWLLACQIPEFAAAEQLQTTIASGIAALYVLATAAELWRGRAERLRSRNPAIVLLIIHLISIIARGWMAASHPGAAIDATLTNGLLLESMLHTIGMALLLLSLTKERAQALASRSVAAVRRTSQVRSRFLAHMAHELRTPLNGLLGFAHVLARDPRLSAGQREQAEALEQSGRHLLNLANDALDLMRIDAGKLELDVRPLDLMDALLTADAIVRARAEEKLIDLVVEAMPGLPQLVLGDRTRLQQILLNLLSNALKFTPTGGRVRLTAAAAPTFGVVFEVADSGPHVPEEKRALLFQAAMSLEPELVEPGEDADLGLSICAGLVRAMGGEIAYRPGPGGDGPGGDGPGGVGPRGVGNVFRVELPLRALPQEREAQIEAPPSTYPTRSLRVLGVDDVASNRLLVRAILEAEGHTVVLAAAGEEAVTLVAQDAFDVVLMDVRMPGMDGLEATRRIRALPGAVGLTPVIGVSADAGRADVAECLAAGMTAHIAKPLDRQALLAELLRATAHTAPSAPGAARG